MSQDISQTDEQIEQLIGKQLKAHRLQRNFSQTELSERAGVARRTITSIENGKGSTVTTLVRLLRALNLDHLLAPLLEGPPISPNQLHKMNMLGEKPRKYASKPRKKTPPTQWKWGDEK